jgi:hypothetical protein
MVVCSIFWTVPINFIFSLRADHKQIWKLLFIVAIVVSTVAVIWIMEYFGKCRMPDYN